MKKEEIKKELCEIMFTEEKLKSQVLEWFLNDFNKETYGMKTVPREICLMVKLLTNI